MAFSSSFRYLAPASRLHVGAGAIDQVRSEVVRAGARRAFIVASHTVSTTTPLVQRVASALGELHAGTFDGARRESPLSTVMAGVEALNKAQADVIVAVGGGSAIVTARAITIVAGEGRPVQEIYTRHVPGRPPQVYRADAPKLPNILVPTTPTTGADRGGAAVWDEDPPHRKELYDPKTRPLAMLVDPEALLTSPHPLYLDTSITTFCGLIDAIQSPDLSALAWADYRQGLQLSLTHLPQLVEHADDPNPRIQLFLAAVLANRGSQSTFNTHGKARTTGIDRILRYQYPQIGQGASNAALLPALLRFNRDIVPDEQARLSAALATPDPPGFLERFLRDLGVATRLRDLNVPREDLTSLAQMELQAPAFGQGTNRINLLPELITFLESAW